MTTDFAAALAALGFLPAEHIGITAKETPMDEHTFSLAVRNDMDGLAFDVHRTVRQAGGDLGDALTALADIEHTVAVTRKALLDLPRPETGR